MFIDLVCLSRPLYKSMRMIIITGMCWVTIYFWDLMTK